MELIRGLHNLRAPHRGAVATIGNFDGVHLGHQAILGRLAEKGAELELPTTVITFEPQPQEFFSPERAPPRLTRFREKLKALGRFSVDRVLLLAFNRQLAEMPAAEFIRRVLVEGLAVEYLVVGDDFRFGRGRAGDFALLQAAGREHGFQVVNMHTFALSEARVSSTRIRGALAAGDLELAAQLLGRPYRLSGRVAHGFKRGRTIGFPTANIHLHRVSSPVSGVFAVELFGVAGEPLAGVANVGIRPTVEGERPLLEVHLFDFSDDLYGHYVHVDLKRKLREERRFESFAALKLQIEQDVIEARRYFGSLI